MKSWNSKFCNNSLELIIRLVLMVVIFIPLLIYMILNNIVITNSFNSFENRYIQNRKELLKTVFDYKAYDIYRIARDYGIWDDAYKAIEDRDSEWYRNNFSNWLPHNFELDMIIVLDKNKKIIDEYGLDNKMADFINDTTVDLILKGYYDVQNKTVPYGFKIYKGQPYLIAMSPIMRSYYLGSTNGVVILGKKINEDFLKAIKEQYGYRIAIGYSNNFLTCREESRLIRANIDKLAGTENIIRINDEVISISIPIKDISEKDIGNLYVLESRNELMNIFALIKRNEILTLLISFIVMILLSLVLIRLITLPIKEMEEQIADMEKSNRLGEVRTAGYKELISLGAAFNRMLDRLSNHKKENERLRLLSITDKLTSLYNSQYFFEYFQEKINQQVKKITLLFCDVDKLKLINDTMGHIYGDRVLKEIGNIIKSTGKDNTAAFRYGGDEFVIVLDDCPDQDACMIAERIRHSVYTSTAISEHMGAINVSISIGIASYPKDAENIKELIDKADFAMYCAKSDGKNRYKVYTQEMEKSIYDSISEQTGEDILNDAVYALAAAIDAKDSYTGKHSELVAKYALMLADNIGMSNDEKRVLRTGALLHDCGKIGIPDSIISKAGPLTEDEKKVIENHPTLGSNIIKYIIKTPEIEGCILHHHERWDGKGYPSGLKGEEIPYYARIICIADAFHAMISNRPYRKGLPIAEALKRLKAGKEIQFDPYLVDVFVHMIMTNQDNHHDI